MKTPMAMISQITSKLYGIDGFHKHGFLSVAPEAKGHGLTTKEAVAVISKTPYLRVDRHGRYGYCVMLVCDDPR